MKAKFKSVIAGVVNALPIARSLYKVIFKKSIAPIVTEKEVTLSDGSTQTQPKIDFIALTTEIVSAILVISAALGKISISDVEKLMSFISNQ